MFDKAIAWAKNKAEGEVIGVFSVEVDKLEALDACHKLELRTLRMSDSSEAKLGLWYKSKKVVSPSMLLRLFERD